MRLPVCPSIGYTPKVTHCTWEFVGITDAVSGYVAPFCTVICEVSRDIAQDAFTFVFPLPEDPPINPQQISWDDSQILLGDGAAPIDWQLVTVTSCSSVFV